MVVKMMMNNSSIVSPDYFQPSTCPVHGWKLYDNPVFALTSCNSDASTGIHKQSHCKCSNNNHNHPHRKCESKMKPHKVVQELKMEIELERKVRKKTEALNKKLQDDIDRMRLEFEEERKMLKMAEVLREERLQMKLADANLLFHHKCRELQQTFSNGQEESCKTTVQENVSLHSCEEETSKVRKCHSSCSSSRSTVTSIGDQSNRSTSRNHNYNVSPNVSPYGKGVKKKASPEPENPHIRRGIKGFVEFPRGKLVKALNGSSNYSGVKHRDMATKLECQKSQLRLMLKQKVTPLLSSNPLVTT